MLAGDIYAPKKIRLVDVPEPELNGKPDQIVFQPELACLCGSDMLFFEADYPEYQPQIGQSLHEMIGTVVATSGSKFNEGDRVLCVPLEHFGLYERFTVSQNRAILVDSRPPEDQALLAQPLGTVIFALKKVPPVMDQDVVVMGQGPMGLLFTAALRNLGAREIITVDPIASRREVSRRMGATHTLDPNATDVPAAVQEITGGTLADLVVEAVGHREHVLNACIDACRRDGRIFFFGVPPEQIDGIRWRDLFLKNIAVHTSVGPDFGRDFPLAMRWIAEQRIDVSPLITHRMQLDAIQEAFDIFHARDDGAIKVFLDFPSAG